MRSERIILLVAFMLGISCVSVSGLTAVIKVDDGVNPVDDGQTQSTKRVTITCEFSNGLEFFHKQALQYQAKTPGSAWQSVVHAGKLQSTWDSAGYTVTESKNVNGIQLTLVFTVEASAMSDEGTYKCQIYTLGSDNSETEIVFDQKELEIYAKTDMVVVADTTADGKIEAVAGDSQPIKCIASNGSEPQIDVKVDGAVVLSNVLVTKEPDSMDYTAEGQVTFTKDQDGKQITCSAKVNTFSEPTEGHATLQITAKPTTTCEPKTRAASEGSKASFTCMIDGKPLPTADQVFWTALSDGLRIYGNEDNAEQGLTSVATSTDDGRLQVVLTVTVSATRKTDTFTISAVNNRGAAAEDFLVQLVAPGEERPVGDGDGNGGSTLTLTSGLSTMLLLFLGLIL